MGDIRAEILRMSRVSSPTVSIKTQLLANRYEEVVGALLTRIGVLEDRLKRQTPVASAASYAATAARGAHLVASPAAPVANDDEIKQAIPPLVLRGLLRVGGVEGGLNKNNFVI